MTENNGYRKPEYEITEQGELVVTNQTQIEDVIITRSTLDDGRIEHYAELITETGAEWIATYIDPPAPRHPGQSGFHWDSLEGFHQWIRWTRR
jgi:hypothetical protein